MNKQILFILTIIVLLSCGKQAKKEKAVDKETTKVERSNSNIDSLTTTSYELESAKKINQSTIERYFPEEKEIVEFDTILDIRNLKISIQSSFLDSYVKNEFESDGVKYIDKYRDSEKHLRIIMADQVLVDTIFKKEDFLNYTGKEFLDIAKFHGYWFNKIDEESIEFFGTINKPETDWSFAFYHFFDLTANKFFIEEYVDEEI